MKKGDILPRPTLAFDPVNRRHLSATPACRGARDANGGLTPSRGRRRPDPRPSLFRRGLRLRKRSCAGPTCARLGAAGGGGGAVLMLGSWSSRRGFLQHAALDATGPHSLSLVPFAAGSFSSFLIFMDSVPFALAGISGTASFRPVGTVDPSGRSDRPIFFTQVHDPPRRSKLEGLPGTNVAASDVSSAAGTCWSSGGPALSFMVVTHAPSASSSKGVFGFGFVECVGVEILNFGSIVGRLCSPNRKAHCQRRNTTIADIVSPLLYGRTKDPKKIVDQHVVTRSFALVSIHPPCPRRRQDQHPPSGIV
jgi:hypothetical protein